MFDYNRKVQIIFSAASYADKEKSEPKDDKRKSEPKTEESIAERVKLRRKGITEIEEEEKNTSKVWFNNYFTNYQDPSDMYKKLRETEGARNENQVYLFNQRKVKYNKKKH